MKNADKYRKRTCIIMDLDEYKQLIEELSNGYVDVDVDYCDNQIIYDEHDEDDEEAPEFEVNKELSKYFDVEVTSVHIDGFDYPYVWIVYKEN